MHELVSPRGDGQGERDGGARIRHTETPPSTAPTATTAEGPVN